MTAIANRARAPDDPTPPQGAALGDLGRPMFHRVIPADPMAVRQALADITKRFGALPPERLSRLELALAEILNNIVEHGYANRPAGQNPVGQIHVSIVPTDGGLSCAIADDGVMLPQTCLTQRNDPLRGSGADPGNHLLCLPEGGFGWLLIQGLTQNLCHFRENGRNMLAFFVPRDDPGA